MKVFSDREQDIIKIIGRKRITLTEISVELFKKRDEPFDSVISVSNAVRRIVKKCSYHNLDWTLTKTRKHKKLTIKREKL